MAGYPEFVIAAVQAAPVYFDREASTEKACGLIGEAGRKGATLAVFGETWLPGYPFFNRAPRPLLNRARAEYIENAVEIPSKTTDRLCGAARGADVDAAIGIAELDPETKGTVYCTILFIGREGAILGRHRKLKPTDAERRVWGEGDGVGLVVHERPYGRLSGLNCWEHNMVLPGYALMAQGTQIHAALWPYPKTLDDSFDQGLLLSRAFASQGSCYVAAACGLLRPGDVPQIYRDTASARADEHEGNRGGSRIIAPGGRVIAECGPDEETILTAPVSLEAVLEAKGMIDVGGHYSRPDILQLLVNRRPLTRLVEPDSGGPHRGESGVGGK
jgi:predicted amidohydrolase